LDYNYANGAAVFHSAVYEDGSFSDWVTNKLSGMAAHLEGQIMGEFIEATTHHRGCTNQLHLNRVSS
jgi:hypothetical protein